MINHLLTTFFLWYFERQLSTIPRENLTEEQKDGLMSQLWANQAFRDYIKERNSKIIYTIAGISGEEPEPRPKTLIKHGQRVELLLLGTRAKGSWDRKNKRAIEKRKELTTK